MSLTPGRIWRGAPSIGEDTTDNLSTLLGLTAPDIQRLSDAQSVHRTPPCTTPRVEAVDP